METKKMEGQVLTLVVVPHGDYQLRGTAPKDRRNRRK